MAFKAGTASVFYLANAAGALQNVQPYVDNIGAPQTVQMLETSVLGTAAKTFMTGLTDGDVITISGPYDAAILTQLYALKAAQNAGSAAAPYIFGPGGSVAAQTRTAGSVLVQQVNPAVAVAGRVEYSASLQVTGAVTNGTF